MMNAIGRTGISAAILAVSFLGGCTKAPGEDVAEGAMAVLVDNGIHMNGLYVNGIHMNGIHMNGLEVNGTTLQGFSVEGMTLKGTSFSGTWKAASVSGLGFIGAQMTAAMPGGGVLLIRIDNIVPSDDPDILLYDVSSSFDGVNWAALCRDRAGLPVRSYPLSGLWDESQSTPTGGDHIDDPSQFTFACQGYVLAKCTEMGYKPWASAKECEAPDSCHEVPLSYLHQSCTRMLRADYCGDGLATTRDGTLIDVTDNFGFEEPSKPTWLFEAEWGYDGATCIRNIRWPTIEGVEDDAGIKVKSYINKHCPGRWVGPKNLSCGGWNSSFYTAKGFSVPLTTRSLLMTRVSNQTAPTVGGKQKGSGR
jgi:hypothetical protein